MDALDDDDWDLDDESAEALETAMKKGDETSDAPAKKDDKKTKGDEKVKEDKENDSGKKKKAKST
jgi:hypothetical protein